MKPPVKYCQLVLVFYRKPGRSSVRPFPSFPPGEPRNSGTYSFEFCQGVGGSGRGGEAETKVRNKSLTSTTPLELLALGHGFGRDVSSKEAIYLTLDTDLG